MNFTFEAPNGATNHGDHRIICLPPEWFDYAAFFFANYLAHAATLHSNPGASFTETLIAALTALFIPGFGVLNTLKRIFTHSGTIRNDDLRRAARSGALVIIRICEEDSASAIILDKQDLKEPKMVPRGRKLYGTCIMPTSMTYQLIELPPQTPLRSCHGGASLGQRRNHDTRNIGSLKDATDVDDGHEVLLGERAAVGGVDQVKLSYTYNIPKMLVGAVQAIWGVITLYHSRGTQINKYGYAAFGLSAAPYAIMSLVNFAVGLLTPEYQTMYLVHTPDLDRARKEGGVFDGVVAAVDMDRLYDVPKPNPWKRRLYRLAVVSLAATPLIIVGVLSHGFQTNESTVPQRVWMMSWLIIGSFSSAWVRGVYEVAMGREKMWNKGLVRFLLAFVFYVPAIGGMVTVGLELKEYGICTRLV
ncbi:hypothetical protein PG989_013839 [Apiospora arundinis]